mgnify:CR=1 FL=1
MDAPLRQPDARAAAYRLLALLSAINLVNYMDRYLLAPVVPAVRAELQITNAQAGALVTAFFLVYMLAAPVVGWLADRYPRKLLIAGGVALWSVATWLSGWAPTYGWLLASRALVGIGEASYSCIVPALLCDLFPREQRGRVLSVFYAAIPVGAALGYVVGGWVGTHFGWRSVFNVGAAPGLVLSCVMLAVREPQRGATDVVTETAALPIGLLLRRLFHNRDYRHATLGTALSTFALGGLAFWMPAFLTQVRGIPAVRATLIFGGFTLVNGIIANLVGGWVSDAYLRRHPGAHFLVSGWGLWIGLPLAAVTIFVPRHSILLPAAFGAEFFLFLNGGPLNAATVNSVPAGIRSTALGVNMVLIHLLGDLISPPIIGEVADLTHTLMWGVAVVLPAMALAAIVTLRGAAQPQSRA